METVTRESFNAHNDGRELPCANPGWNKMHKLGNLSERILLQQIAAQQRNDGNPEGRLKKIDIAVRSVSIQ